MFSENGISAADIAAVVGNNNDGFGGNGAIWAILLLALLGRNGWGNNGGASGGGVYPMPFVVNGGGAAPATTADVERAFDTQTIINKLNGLENGLCDGFYAMNTGLLNNTASITSAVTQDTIANMQNTNQVLAQMATYEANRAACCCDMKNAMISNFANLGYNLADQSCQTRRTIADSTRDIIDNQNANTRSILEFLTQDKIATLQAENQSLKFERSQADQNNYLLAALQPAPRPAYVVANPNAAYNACGCCGI